MIEALYAFLNQLGYSHPLHAPATHLPLGLTMGAFVFGVLSRLRRNSSLAATARHCTLLAMVSLPLTMVLGIMDWQHFYAGAWLFPIRMKILLAPILGVLMLICLFLEKRGDVMGMTLLCFLALTLLTSGTLGYFGGELVFAGRSPSERSTSTDYREGAEAFSRSCASCHPQGETPFKPELAPRRAPQLRDFPTFLAYVRAPRARDGSNTIMPPFSEEQLSEKQAKAIYQYIKNSLKGE